MFCPNCDGRNESIHALVLKQLFLHNHPDTVVEDRSFINTNTGKACPTDIVNHRLKIAIEIQSQWHDFEDIKLKDKMKMCKLFFNIDSIPEYVNYDYSNKLNLKEIQSMLNNGNVVAEIASKLNVDKHRIYDAIHNKKLFYPKNYKYNYAIKQEYIL